MSYGPLSMGMGLAGGIFGALGGGGNQIRGLDANTLAALFGPGALGMDAQTLYALLSHSPAFAQQQQQAALQGQMMQSQLNQRLGGAFGGGVSSGIGGTMGALGSGYANQLRSQNAAALWGPALQAAQAGLQNRMGLYGQGRLAQAHPNFLTQLGGSLLGAGAQGLMGGFGGGQQQQSPWGQMGQQPNFFGLRTP